VNDHVSVPSWLTESSEYEPDGSKNGFIDKSILSFLNVISRMRAGASVSSGKYKVNAAFKLAFTFVFILLVSLSRSFAFILVSGAFILVQLSFLSAKHITSVLKPVIFAALLTFLILAPSVFLADNTNWAFIELKVIQTVTAAGIFAHTTGQSEISRALRRFFVPGIFITVLDTAVKYIFLLGEITLNMMYALKLRSVGKNKDKYTSMSGVAGTVFLNSKEMSEQMYEAMVCRGFSGDYHAGKHVKITYTDMFYAAAHILLVLCFIYFAGVVK
jgi:cobalt/nickel transport system permease protein